MGGRIAGLAHLAEPAAFVGLGYGIGKLSGQSDEQALIESLGGVGGAYAAQHLATKLLPKATIKLPSRKGRPAAHLNYAGLGGSVLGGWAGADAADLLFRGLGGKPTGDDINPLLYAVDETALPLVQIAKGFI